ncbi:MAG: TonB-dependent receptor [Chitinophagaceae bacterium]|nr:MAG: TonB-dependent receptor [Chitinophagaceae bacterium]
MRSLFILAAVLFFSSPLFAQTGKVEGKVTDANTGLPLTGVSVVDQSTSKGVATNTDGRYVINVTGKTISLLFSYNGVTQQIDGIEITEGKVTTQDLAITPKTKTEEGVVIRATSTARKETAAAIISFQKNTNTVASVISAESIKRSPDRNTGEVLKRLPGASIQEGKFIVVRGLADRYNQAMLNGILLTSTEPDRKTFSFDLIPSSMIDNIVINKAFVPEFPGEWAGGLIQVNTKDIPAKGFFNIQVGGGFNTQTTGKDFYVDKVGNTSWLGIDDGSRYLPDTYTTKSQFDIKTPQEKTAIGQSLRNKWSQSSTAAAPNASLQINGGFNTKLWGKTVGGSLGVNYNKSNKFLKLLNRLNNIEADSVDVFYSYDDDKYQQDISVGAIGSLTAQLNSSNKISLRSIVNVNTSNAVVHRSGVNFDRQDSIKGSEFTYRQNTFFTVQASGEHTISRPVKLKWYGAFNILDGFIPDQRRLTYSKSLDEPGAPYRAIISNTLSQQSGSRIYQDLSDYIYTAGGDLTYNFDMFNRKQAVKAGYMLQIKDRLYDAKLFANYLPVDNDALRQLSPAQIFAPENFGTGTNNKFAFDAIKGNSFRYLANTILNAGFVQFDNQFSSKFRMVWGVRVEDYDQLVGSVKASDPRHSNRRVTDFLPGLNATYKVNNKTNIRLSGSQTVVRPELRELAYLNLYDFELNLSTQGDPSLERTKITNIDLRYEMYPRAGEVFTIGTFYKNFETPTEQYLNLSTINFINPEKAVAYGVEAEFRKKLDIVNVFKNFTFQANLAFIHSRVKDTAFKLNRPLQGQSPYVLNLGLMYDLPKTGLTATLLFNRIGERIYLVGDVPQGSPDVYEAPRSLVDLQVSKKLLQEKGELRLSISDLLNQKQIFYQNVGEQDKRNYQSGTDVVRFSRKYGSTFSLTFNYSL